MAIKLKTHKGIRKRIKLTKSGKVKYSAGGRSHLLTKKTRKRKRQLRKARVLKGMGQARYIKPLLPYR